ncbi:MAG: hypothetical protein CMJ48_12530 [Planctomycetaceae bacterium]|nr:hypothetical protein [Planctomycetaceae bacterium]
MLAVVQKGPRVLAKWRQENPDVILSLAEAALVDADLRGANLKRADLVGADLRQARLMRADLTRADLTRSELGQAVLQGADLTQAVLIGADLTETNLVRTRLPRANLSRTSIKQSVMRSAVLRAADLSNATLTDVDLADASLRNAECSGAVLTDVDLTEADLTNACFDGAQLKRVRFNGANLTGCRFGGASFSECRFGWSVLGNIDFGQSVGLETSVHDAPSTVGIDTLDRSLGKIPETFLLDAGLASETIARFSDDESPLIRRPVCLISHTENELAFAKTMQKILRQKGVLCWRDEKPNDPEEYDRGLYLARPHLWDAILFCATRQFLSGPWVEDEHTIAVRKEEAAPKTRNKPTPALFVLLLDSYLNSGSWDSPLRPDLSKRAAGDFLSWRRAKDRFLQQADELVERLTVNLKKK